jgi:hypothetical protein
MLPYHSGSDNLSLCRNVILSAPMDPVAARSVKHITFILHLIIFLTILCDLNSGDTVEPLKHIVGCAARVEAAGTSKCICHRFLALDY